MVGIDNLMKNVQNKSCIMYIQDRYCYFRITGVDIHEMLDIINYQSWVYKAYQRAVQIRYINIVKNLSNGNVTLRTTIGFGPLLLRYLRTKGYIISGELFRAEKIILPNMKYDLYDFQKKMEADWLRAGGVGVIKSATGSGKTILACDIISQIQRKTLILVHTSDLLANVWIDSLVKSFGDGITNRIGLVGGGLTNSERMNMKIGTKEGFLKNIDKDIVIATFQTLINNIDRVPNYNFGLTIVDECIPLDSKIWTDNGVIKYENLDCEENCDNDVYSVWSCNDDYKIVNNRCKKIKTKFKHMYKTIVETGDELVCSLDHKVLSIKNNNIYFIEIGEADNVARSLLKPGFRHDKNEKMRELIRLYLQYMNKCNNQRNEIINKYIYSFGDWCNKVRGDFIFLDILRREYRGFEQGYTLTVNNDHNYIVNGFVHSNCHHAPAQMFRKVNSVIKSPYKLGLSATLTRLDGMEKDIFGQLGNIQSSVGIRELINKGILAEPRFQSPIIIDSDIINKIEKCGYSGLEYSRFVKKQSASSKKKMNYVINICRNIAGRNRKFLLFTDYVAAEDVYIRDMYVKELINFGVPVGYIDQGMAADERANIFQYLETGEILGIVLGKLGSEGVNIPSVNAVVMANGIKSPITFTQRVGRAMRKTPDKDFCDVYEVLLDIPIELRWSDFNFAEYRAEGFQKLVYKVE